MLSTRNSKLSNRATAENRYHVGRFYFRHYGSHVRSWKNVRHQNGLIVGNFFGKFYQHSSREGYARILGLQSIQAASFFRAAKKDCSSIRAARVSDITLRVIAGPAVNAASTSHRRWHN